MTKALLITLMLAAAGGSAMARSLDNAHPDCANRLLHRKAIEHGYHHQPTTAEIACKQAIRGQSSVDANTGRAITELYERAMRRSAPSERGATLE
jgi:hypothetical protein